MSEAELKTLLRAGLPRRDWAAWIREAVLLRTISFGGAAFYLLALPPIGAVLAAARAREQCVRQLMRSRGCGIGFTIYPDEWQREQARQRYGIEFAPTPARRACCSAHTRGRKGVMPVT